MSRSHFVLLCALLGANVAFAAPRPQPSHPDTSQEAVVFEKLQDLVRFENDGSGLRENTTVVRAQSQAGVQGLGQLIVGYSSLTETLQIDYVRVRKPDGRVVETWLADAQDFAPEILRQAPMYSDYREKHISVANLQAGDVLEYHTITHVKPLAANEFWYAHRFPRFAAVMNESLEIDVPKSRGEKCHVDQHRRQLNHKNLGMLLSELKRDNEARTELELAASIPPDDPQIKLALAQLYARIGESEKSEALTKSVLGTTSQAAGKDIFAPALTDGINPEEVIHDARSTLDDIGDQFDSGQYDRLGPASFTAMNLVALAWARIGWAKSLEGDLLEAIQFLNSSWMLSDSGTVANRLAHVLEKENQKDKARHMYALAAAAGGPEADASRQQVTRLAASPNAASQDLSEAESEFVKMRTVKLPGTTSSKGTAHFVLVFDASSKPNRVEYVDGDSALQGVSDKLRTFDYPVKFPDASSIKIIRRAIVSCDGGTCSAVLLPLEALQP